MNPLGIHALVWAGAWSHEECEHAVRSTREAGYDIVEIEICSHDGRAVLEIDRDLLREFVDLTFDVVAPGEEADHMNIEEEIARITRSCAE